jgi:ribonuclease Y
VKIIYNTLLIVIVSLVPGLIVGYFIRKFIAEARIQSAEEESRKILEEAEREAESKIREITLEAKEKAQKIREDANRESQKKKK